MPFDNDEIGWIKRFLKRKSENDVLWMHSMFVKHYSKLMDSTIRKHYKKMCLKCYGGGGEHLCEDETSSLLLALGGSVLDYASKEERKATWCSFLDEMCERGVFKKVIVIWMKEFEGAIEKIDKNCVVYCDYMRRHFPNTTKNPEQLYLDYDDYDEIG